MGVYTEIQIVFGWEVSYELLVKNGYLCPEDGCACIQYPCDDPGFIISYGTKWHSEPRAEWKFYVNFIVEEVRGVDFDRLCDDKENSESVKELVRCLGVEGDPYVVAISREYE